MRKGFDSLCGIVTRHMQLNALSGGIFIFINKKRNQVKLLLWEGDGLSLYYKRLEQGAYELPPYPLYQPHLQISRLVIDLCFYGNTGSTNCCGNGGAHCSL